MYILVSIKWHVSANYGHHQLWPYLLRFHYVNELWCGDLNISLCYAVSICCRWKEESKETKTIYIALVTLESPSRAVTYRHGVALVLLFSRDMWVPLWVTGVGSVLHVWSPCVLSHPRFRIWSVSRVVRWGSTPVCHSSMKFFVAIVFWL